MPFIYKTFNTQKKWCYNQILYIKSNVIYKLFLKRDLRNMKNINIFYKFKSYYLWLKYFYHCSHHIFLLLVYLVYNKVYKKPMLKAGGASCAFIWYFIDKPSLQVSKFGISSSPSLYYWMSHTAYRFPLNDKTQIVQGEDVYHKEGDPTIFAKAMSFERNCFLDRTNWWWNAFPYSNTTCILIYLPQGCKIHGCKWVFVKSLSIKPDLLQKATTKTRHLITFTSMHCLERNTTIGLMNHDCFGYFTISLFIHQVDVTIAFPKSDLDGKHDCNNWRIIFPENDK